MELNVLNAFFAYKILLFYISFNYLMSKIYPTKTLVLLLRKKWYI